MTAGSTALNGVGGGSPVRDRHKTLCLNGTLVTALLVSTEDYKPLSQCLGSRHSIVNCSCITIYDERTPPHIVDLRPQDVNSKLQNTDSKL